MLRLVIFAFGFVLFHVGCGRLPAQYNQLTLRCGELNPEDLSSAQQVIQVVDENGQPDLTVQEAKWISSTTSKLSVSRSSCVVLPAGTGFVKILSQDRKKGLVLKPSPPVAPGLLMPVTLMSLELPTVRVSCGREMVKDLNELFLEFQDESPSVATQWPIESIELRLIQSNRVLSVVEEKPELDFFLNRRLIFRHPKIPDGEYTIEAGFVTIAGERISLNPTCPVTLDQTPPEKLSTLASKISDGRNPLQLLSSRPAETLYYCIAQKPDDCTGTCQDHPAFERAADYVAAPESGAFTLYSFAKDEVGNCSPMQSETFFRDINPPQLQVTWLTPHLRAGYDWAVRPQDSYELAIKASDNAVDAAFGSDEDLQASVTCQASITDPTGARRPASEIVCTQGLCAGSKLDRPVPCMGGMRFSFIEASESNIQGSQVQIEVAAKDKVGLQSSSKMSFWLNPQSLEESWVVNRSFPIADQDFSYFNPIEFSSLNDGRLLAWFSKDDGVSIHLKDKGARGFSPAIKIELPPSSEEAGYYGIALASDRLLHVTNNLRGDGTSSLWLSGTIYTSKTQEINRYLVEVPLPPANTLEYPKTIQAIFHPFSAEVLEGFDFKAGAMAYEFISAFAVVHERGQEKLVMILQGLERGPLLVAFDGKNYSVINQEETLQDFYDPLLLRGPGNRLLTIRNDEVSIFDLSEKPKTTVNPLDMNGMVLPPLDRIVAVSTDGKQFMGLIEGSASLLVFSLTDDAKLEGFEVLIEDNLASYLSNYRLVRRADGSYWLADFASDGQSRLYSFRLNIDHGWQLQNDIWGWPTVEGGSGIVYGFGIDTWNDQLLFVSGTGGTSKALRMTQSNNFMEVTDQGVWRQDIESARVKILRLGRDKEGRIVRTQVLANRRLLVAPLKIAEAVNSVSMKGLPDVMQGGDFFTELLFDAQSRIWFAPHIGLEAFPYDYEQNSFGEPFSLEKSGWNQMFFGPQGDLFGILGGSLHRLRRLDGVLEALPQPDGTHSASIERLNSGLAWIQYEARFEQSRAPEFSLWKLNPGDATPTKLQMDQQLDSPTQKVLAMTDFGNIRLAAVATPSSEIIDTRSGPLTKERLDLYENDGSGWKPWKSELQPCFPSWHKQAGQRLFGAQWLWSKTTVFKDLTGAIWLATKDLSGELLLAHFEKGRWTFYNPQLNHLHDLVEEFILDDNGWLYLRTDNKLYLYNPLHAYGESREAAVCG